MLTELVQKYWRTIKFGSAALAASAALSFSAKSEAHEIAVHKWITAQAVEYIERNAGKIQKMELGTDGETYQKVPLGSRRFNQMLTEFKQYLPEMLDGVADEDSLTISKCNPKKKMTGPRFFRHFYNPTNKAGYCQNVDVNKCIPFENALAWTGLNNDGNNNEFFGKNNKNNGCDYFDVYTTTEYNPEDNRSYEKKMKDAYFKHAHIFHLIQDLTLPEHTHGEAHGHFSMRLPVGTTTIKFTMEIVRQFGLEAYCAKTLKQKGSLPLPTEDDKFVIYPMDEYLERGARISYFLNRTHGNPLKDGEYNLLNKMFHIEYDGTKKSWMIQNNADVMSWKDEDNKGYWSGEYKLTDEWWEIIKFPQHIEKAEKIGWYYIEASQKAYPEFFKIGWRKHFESMPTDRLMQVLNVDRHTAKDDAAFYRRVNGGKSMAVLLSEELVPLAVEYTAGAMIQFWMDKQGD